MHPMAARITESLKYLSVVFQLKTNYLLYIQAVLQYKTKRRVTFPKAHVRLKGCRFIARPNTMDIAHLSGLYENETTAFLLDYAPDVFIDVGAHIGRFTVLLAKHGSQVVAIEPGEETFARLQMHVSLNQLLAQTTLLNFGCSDHSGETLLYHNPFNEGEHSLIASEGATTQPVRIATLDQIVSDLNLALQPKSVIKIDVEGAELAVLHGSSELLKNHAPLLVVEMLQNQKEITTYLKEMEYHHTKTLDMRNFIFEKI